MVDIHSRTMVIIRRGAATTICTTVAKTTIVAQRPAVTIDHANPSITPPIVKIPTIHPPPINRPTINPLIIRIIIHHPQQCHTITPTLQQINISSNLNSTNRNIHSITKDSKAYIFTFYTPTKRPRRRKHGRTAS